ncbi:RBBP9/YdeN family alpha/beta hydrolase [Larkinella rosea]|uniref:Serine hydrolase family protein n=1 Tax=Larkinella rosea TaxID=2025312 RepID=A0A3P1C3C5_9BACT|nr:alpha/beta fold hydrolase [Larkinella rosea]RRB07324.1 serine hydrolase family protein [Larkinella rosea]
MKKQVLFIHSAGPQGAHAGSGDLVANLKQALGPQFRVISPKMPDPENPSYESWKHQLEKELLTLENDAILVGHSLGGSVLLKHLSEEYLPKPVAGLCVVAAPYWGKRGWKSKEFTLPNNLSKLAQLPGIFVFHSSDDEVVPPDHLTYYAEKLPFASVLRLSNGGHLFTHGSPELVAAIKRLAKTDKLKRPVPSKNKPRESQNQ